MDSALSDQLGSYLESLDESALRSLIVEFCYHQGVKAAIVHGTGEHGIDVLAYVRDDKDFIRKGYNLLIQVKKGRLTIRRWRSEVLGQLYEATYYPQPHELYIDHHPRRVLLIVVGTTSSEVRNSIHIFNTRHEATLEICELRELVDLFEKTGFADVLLERIGEVGVDLDSGQGRLGPPVVGEGD